MTKHAINAGDAIVTDYLKKPYTRQLIPEDDGTFRSEILEFSGCIATGETREEAIAKIEDVAASWLASALTQGQSIPTPIESNDFSGKIVVRFPRSLHKKAAQIAEIDGVSLNQLIVASVAQYIGQASAASAPKDRMAVFINNAFHFMPAQNTGLARTQIFGAWTSPASLNFDKTPALICLEG
jgi:predicted RNase H-like HicB family nuclease